MQRPKPRGRPPHPDQLTQAEWRVVDAVRHGMTSRVIAQQRGISIDAVKYHVANALLKLGLPNRAALRTWPGIARHTLLHAQEKAMTSLPEAALALGQIGQISRTVTNIEAATAWYRDVAGLPHLYSFGTLAFFDCGGTRLFLSQQEGASKPESILYFQVADIRAAHAALASRGALFINAPHLVHRHADGTEEWMAMFNDNEGRVLAIMARVGGGRSSWRI
jgi:DNA-binding CsgD family transcriptional regulator/catechol 2,3-dioxygenase-like lactoylglutathione lyase family enzyme